MDPTDNKKKMNSKENNGSIIILSKGLIVKVDGLPFELESDTIVSGSPNNVSLLSKNYKSFGVPSVLKVAQSETSETTIPSSESM